MQKFFKIKGIVFDLDYTLFDEHIYFFKVYEIFCSHFNLTSKLSLIKKLHMDYRGRSKDIFHDVLNDSRCNEIIYKNFLFNKYISASIKISPYKDVFPIFNFLKGKKIKLGLLTNGTVEAQKNKIRSLGIEKYFDAIIFAREFGKKYEKPHRKSFEEMINKMAINSQLLLFVGDNPRTDFEVPYTLGSPTFRLLNGIYSHIESDVNVNKEIKSLEQIKKFLIC